MMGLVSGFGFFGYSMRCMVYGTCSDGCMTSQEYWNCTNAVGGYWDLCLLLNKIERNEINKEEWITSDKLKDKVKIGFSWVEKKGEREREKEKERERERERGILVSTHDFSLQQIQSSSSKMGRKTIHLLDESKPWLLFISFLIRRGRVSLYFYFIVAVFKCLYIYNIRRNIFGILWVFEL